MALAVEAPAREDLSFRTNDDRLVGARWFRSDGLTPVVITRAVLTLRFEPLPAELGEPFPPVEEHIIDSDDHTTPTDPAGWIHAGGLAEGAVLVTVPHTIWPNYSMRTGGWDLIAIGEGTQRCLVRGVFVAEEGISS